MNQDAFRALLELLPQIFPTPAALGAWLGTSVPDGDRIVNNLPGSNVSPAQYFYAAADILRRWGLLGVPEFWDPLEDETNFVLGPKVVDLRATFGVPPRKTPRKPKPGPTTNLVADPPVTTPPAATPTKINVLLVSASPNTVVRVRVDLEFRNIIAKMRSTELRDRINFIQLQAARFEDLRSALLLYKPHILHISSHGEDDGSLRFEDGLVAKSKLLKLLKALRDNLRLLFVNACFSQEIVQDTPSIIDAAIGMSDEVDDKEAMKFAVSFYEAIGYGRTVENSFDIANADLDDEVVRLYPLDGPKRQLVLVAS